MKTDFLNDIIACLSFIVTFLTKNLFILFCLFSRLNSIKKIIYSLDGVLQISHKYPVHYDLVRLIIIIIYVALYCGCGFHFLSILEIQYGIKNTWLENMELLDESFSERFVNSLYFSFITMITVGYGDIHPFTIFEKLYVILMTLISCGIFAYSVNTIGNIF